MSEDIGNEIIIYGINNLTEDYLYVFLNSVNDIKIYNMTKIDSFPSDIDNFKKSIVNIEELLKEVLKIFDPYNNDIEINYTTQTIYVRRAFKVEEKEYENITLKIEMDKKANDKNVYVVQAGLFNLNKYLAQIESDNLYEAITISINGLINYINSRIDKYNDILDKVKNIRMNKTIYIKKLNKLEIIRNSLKNILSYAEASYEKNKKQNNSDNIMEKLIKELKEGQ